MPVAYRTDDMATTTSAKKCHATGCNAKLTGRQRKWCSETCRTREAMREQRALASQARHDPESVRRGPCYEAIVKHGLFALWKDGDLSYEGVRAEVAAITGVEYAIVTVNAAILACRIDERLESLDDDWILPDEVIKMLCLEPPPVENQQELEQWLTKAVDAFVQFRHRYFRTPRGSYVTKQFHRRWIKSILRAIVTGGQQMILSPPRHGKTELLVHFCVWLIVRDPDIRIMWVGANSDIAGDATEAVKDHLEKNTRLIQETLPPSKSYAPRSRTNSRTWKRDKFVVNCRTAVGAKSPTMVAVGRSGKILSRDVDFIITDDIDDQSTTREPAVRKATRTFFFQTLDSRKEEHTAWVVIGSRQHPDDIYNYLLQAEDWLKIVEAAHDPACQLDEFNETIHLECMLFPEMRTYRWLMTKKRGAEAIGQPELYDMVYQNKARPEGLIFWTRELAVTAFDYNRGLGIPKNHEHVYRLGGLDPSATRYQSGFLWGIDLDCEDGQEFMIDTESRKGGGIDPFMELGDLWLELYGVRHWVVEANMWRQQLNDPALLNWAAERGIILEPHETQGNKHDAFFGVGSMRRKYGAEGRPSIVNLPYGTPEARVKTERYVDQCLNFTDNAQSFRNRTTDELMASWFPQTVIRRLRSEALAAASAVDDERSYSGFDMSDYDSEMWN